MGNPYAGELRGLGQAQLDQMAFDQELLPPERLISMRITTGRASLAAAGAAPRAPDPLRLADGHHPERTCQDYPCQREMSRPVGHLRHHDDIA